jgi:hypothetical protein
MLLGEFLTQPAFHADEVELAVLPGAGPPSISHKAWVGDYDRVRRQHMTTTFNPSRGDIDSAFGDLDALDDILLGIDIGTPIHTRQFFQSEDDCKRGFNERVMLPIRFALQSIGVVERWQAGPMGHTTTSKTVDISWAVGDVDIMILEFKKHRTIDADTWTGAAAEDANRVRLGKELRG